MNVTVIRKIRRAALFALLGALTVLCGTVNRIFEGDVYKYESVDVAIGTEALERSQGVTTDGEAWIFSGKSSLSRVALDGETVLAVNRQAIPKQFQEDFGSAHIGGISYANGCVYAAIEDSHTWEHPLVALFDAQTLEYTGKYVELPGRSSGSAHALTHGVPWVACDVQHGVFFVGECDDTTALDAYSLTTFDYLASVTLSQPVDEIQGGEMYGESLYVATNDATRAVYKIALDAESLTGAVTKVFDRILYQPKKIDNFGGEGEDMTVLPMADGTVFHALNIGALFIDANLRHYKPVEPESFPEPAEQPETTYVQQ